MEQNKSEVARIRRQITLEYEAAQRGLTGLAITARHDFIQARMVRIAEYHQTLVKEVGAQEAIKVVCEAAIASAEVQAQ